MYLGDAHTAIVRERREHGEHVKRVRHVGTTRGSNKTRLTSRESFHVGMGWGYRIGHNGLSSERIIN